MRDDTTIALSQAWSFIDYHTIITPLVIELIQNNSSKQKQQIQPNNDNNNNRILDLCSGSGGLCATIHDIVTFKIACSNKY